MTLTLILFVITVAAMLTLVFAKPAVHVGRWAVSVFWVPPVCGVLAVLAFGILSFGEIGAGLVADTAVNPIEILVLFFSMTLLSVFLDEAGVFRYLAGQIMRHAGSGQKRLFVALYLMVSVLTVFTSNDIIVLTFTPFICYFAKHARIDPLPFLFCEFVAANTWSLMLIIGNPTNIYLGGSAGLLFADYVSHMWLPTVLAGAASFLVLFLLFHRQLSKKISGDAPEILPMDKPAAVLGTVMLGGCVVFLVLSSYLDLPMWLIAAAFCVTEYVIAFVMQLIRGRGMRLPLRSLLRAPLDIVPFVLSMFVLVMALDKVGVTAWIANALAGEGAVWGYGIASCLFANVLNNIPMSVLFSSVYAAGGTPFGMAPLLAAVIGSNVGAFLTPMGALAGIMWMAMLREQGVKLSFLRFSLYGAIVCVPTLLAALLGLMI